MVWPRNRHVCGKDQILPVNHLFSAITSLKPTEIAKLPNHPINPIIPFPPLKTRFKFQNQSIPSRKHAHNTINLIPNTHETKEKNLELVSVPTMSDILDSSRAQNLEIQLQTFGPFFRITGRSLATRTEVGRAEGLIRLWFGGKILHLDSMRLRRETIGMEKSIFGIGLFIGAVAIRHGYECGCNKAELLAINDTDLYHAKLVRFYTRIGFKPVYEVTGSSIGDLSHMLVWGGVGTRMDANLDELMIKWCSRFKPSHKTTA